MSDVVVSEIRVTGQIVCHNLGSNGKQRMDASTWARFRDALVPYGFDYASGWLFIPGPMMRWWKDLTHGTFRDTTRPVFTRTRPRRDRVRRARP